jgi:DNA-binding IclR family transcriptional regulator
MSSTLLRGLRLLETVDFYGPLTISALARQVGVDKATASRMVAACEVDGWLVRDSGGVRIGPRAAMLGQDTPAGHAFRSADPLVHAVCGVTGLQAQALGLVGRSAVVMASASPNGEVFRYGLTTRFPLWLTAAAKVLAAQLPPDRLDVMLPADPFPEPAEVLSTIAPQVLIDAFMRALGADPAEVPAGPYETSLVRDRAALDAQLAQINEEGRFVDRGEIVPQASCIAVPWLRQGIVAAMAVVGPTPMVDEGAVLIERVLRAAVRPGASRESIVAAAAEK